MTVIAMKSSSPTVISETEKLKRAKFALLARVGHSKRVASQYQEEATFYYTTATELLALSTELVLFLQEVEKQAPTLRSLTLRSTSRLHRSLKKLLSFWPSNTDSQERILTLLNSRGLDGMTGVTADGYLSLSSDQILANVERAIAVSVARKDPANPPSQRTSSDSTTKPSSPSAGTSGDDDLPF